jgi:hypothetical protein
VIAALFVHKRGVYFDLPGVDPWDEERDAKKYAGPYPVVAHPPCAAWCRLAGLRESTHKLPRYQDNGCFSAALVSVRRFGGVLEHPAESKAFELFGLGKPIHGAWTLSPSMGWITAVDQAAYGHKAIKRTWLYYYSPKKLSVPPSLNWKMYRASETTGIISANKKGVARERARLSGRVQLSHKAASATPIPFRDLLISIAEAAL